MSDIYTAMAPFYDEINGDIDYGAWADFLDGLMKRNARPVREVLDLGCGTGSMTIELAKRGYDMTGVDLSPEMLDMARKRAGDPNILWLCQDMRELELFGTVQAAVCCLDCINHLTDAADVRRTLSLVHNYLEPDGLFVFDVNSRRRFTEDYGEQVYTYEVEGGFAVWQNFYNAKSRLCDFDITLFREEADGRYRRYDEHQRERYYPTATLKRLLAECGFAPPQLYGDAFQPLTAGEGDAYRLHFVCRAIK